MAERAMGGQMDRRGWYLDKGMNPVYVGALISIVIAFFSWARYIDNSQVAQDSEIKSMKDTTDKLEKRTREDMQEIRASLQRIIENQEKRK